MHNSYRVGFLDLIRSNEDDEGGDENEKNENLKSSKLARTQKSVCKSLLRILILIYICDLICTVIYEYYFNAKVENFTSLLKISFRRNLNDIAILTLFRIFMMPLLSYLAIVFYRKKKQGSRRKENQRSTTTTTTSSSSSSSLRTPLVASTKDDQEEEEEKTTTTEQCIRIADHVKGRKANAEIMDEDAKRARSEASFYKHLFLSLLFTVSTGIQVYTGIKTLDFNYTRNDPKISKNILIFLVCISVLWINLEAWVLRELVNELTRDHGLYLKTVHRHALFFDDGVASHWCDLCRQRTNKAWRCKLCDFDACPKCVARKKTATSAEDQIRSDKQGVRETKKMTNTQYFFRALKLAKGEWKLFLFAFVFLVLTAFANLALPNTQGAIVNQIIENDRDEFKVHLKIYLCVMIALGVFNGIKGLLFMIVSRRIAFHARNKLFAALIRQDVAFFDGTTSGRLTSRLTNDIGMMLQPIQNTMSTLCCEARERRSDRAHPRFVVFFYSPSLPPSKPNELAACRYAALQYCDAVWWCRDVFLYVLSALHACLHDSWTNTLHVGYVLKLVETFESFGSQ